MLAQRGLVDVPLLLDLRGGTMTRCFRLCCGYVTDRRHTIYPGLYSGLEVLTDTYARRIPRPRVSSEAGGPPAGTPAGATDAARRP